MDVSQPMPSSQIAEVIKRWAPYGRSGLLPCLQEIQDLVGYLSPAVCNEVSRGLRVPLADIYGVITFYSLLYDHPIGRVVVRVCDDVPCYLRGSTQVLTALEEALQIRAGETTADGGITLEVHPCLGRCERAPFLLINDQEVGPVRPDEAVAKVHQARKQQLASEPGSGLPE